MNPRDALVLAVLFDAPGRGMYVAEIARVQIVQEREIPARAVSDVLDRLVRGGLAERRHDPNDDRLRYHRLTSAGRFTAGQHAAAAKVTDPASRE
jgi:DNA-binding MarR family transcriptional regulator